MAEAEALRIYRVSRLHKVQEGLETDLPFSSLKATGIHAILLGFTHVTEKLKDPLSKAIWDAEHGSKGCQSPPRPSLLWTLLLRNLFSALIS